MRMRLWQSDQVNIPERFAWYLADAYGCVHVVDISGVRSCENVPAPSIALGTTLSLDASRLDGAHAPAAVLTCPADHQTPDPSSLQRALDEQGLQATFVGWAALSQAGTLVAVVEHGGLVSRETPRSDFRVVAFVPTYNESDIIAHTLEDLTEQGVDVYVVDNWSTDDTVARAQAFTGRGLIGVERFPPDVR